MCVVELAMMSPVPTTFPLRVSSVQTLCLTLRWQARYDLVANNCECFVNRVMHGQSTSTQVINTAIGVLLFAGMIYFLKSSR